MTLTPVSTTLVIGSSAGARETVIAAAIAGAVPCNTAVILEGMPDGIERLASTDTLSIARIAPGCPCCIGNLTMRVTLNRILRHAPARLYISLATAAHLHQVRQFLSEAPYDRLLVLTADIDAVD